MNLTKKTFSFLLTILVVFSLTGQGVLAAEPEDNADGPVSLKFDFGSEDSPVADGYEKVTNKTLYSDETGLDRKSTRLNSSHVAISYAVFCLKKTNKRSRTKTHD